MHACWHNCIAVDSVDCDLIKMTVVFERSQRHPLINSTSLHYIQIGKAAECACAWTREDRNSIEFRCFRNGIAHTQTGARTNETKYCVNNFEWTFMHDVFWVWCQDTTTIRRRAAAAQTANNKTHQTVCNASIRPDWYVCIVQYSTLSMTTLSCSMRWWTSTTTSSRWGCRNVILDAYVCIFVRYGWDKLITNSQSQSQGKRWHFENNRVVCSAFTDAPTSYRLVLMLRILFAKSCVCVCDVMCEHTISPNVSAKQSQTKRLHEYSECEKHPFYCSFRRVCMCKTGILILQDIVAFS